jgi:glycyl-tRNA synthetase beta chain
MTHHDLLLEIGVEELPSSFVSNAVAALPAIATKRLAQSRLAHGKVRAFGTPRRLALMVDALVARQPDLSEDLVGPSAAAAFDKQGQPTRAAEAFAKKLGCRIDELRTVDTPKGKYLAGTRREAGAATATLLPEALASTVAAIPFRKSMRWGSGDATFGRPVQWLVGLYGDDVIDFQFGGIHSGRRSRGHRFLCKEPVDLARPAEYVDALERAHVIVEPEQRASIMQERLRAAAEQAGGTLIDDDFLFAENLSLVEEPHVITGGFDPAFLSLPETVILEVAKGHQRYFGIRAKDGKLLPRYLAVVNTAENEENVRRGNDRVMRARLADARFFFDEDRKVPLASRREKLSGIVFQARLGNVLAKSERIERLAAEIGRLASIGREAVDAAVRGARLAKCDLVTLMVGEFPDLQGSMGRDYALAQGESPAVADVIRDHYAPRGAADPTAPSDAAALVALADRLDTLVGCLAIGLAPTGAADPFALRRAAIGILRTVLDRGYDLSLKDAVAAAYAGYDGVSLDLALAALSAKAADFFRDRLRGLLCADLPSDVVDACLAAAADRPSDVRARALALSALTADVRAGAGEVFKRATNIAKEAPPGPPVAPSTVQPDAHPSETALFEAFGTLAGELAALGAGRQWADAFGRIAAFAPLMHQYFADVFVMVDDARVRDNRLRLMRSISELCSGLAHFQLLSGTAQSSG